MSISTRRGNAYCAPKSSWAPGSGKTPDATLTSRPFHAAQALILARSGKVVKTHRGVHRQFSQLAKNEAGLREFSRFLSQAYNLKDIADYELGPSAAVPLDRAEAAIAMAERFVDRVAEILT